MQKQESRGRESSPALLNKPSGAVQCKEKTRKKRRKTGDVGVWRKRGKMQKGRWTGGRGREKGGVQERGRAKAFKRLLVTKLMGSFIPCFCRSFTRSFYTLCRFALASVLNGGGKRAKKSKHACFYHRSSVYSSIQFLIGTQQSVVYQYLSGWIIFMLIQRLSHIFQAKLIIFGDLLIRNFDIFSSSCVTINWLSLNLR